MNVETYTYKVGKIVRYDLGHGEVVFMVDGLKDQEFDTLNEAEAAIDGFIGGQDGFQP